MQNIERMQLGIRFKTDILECLIVGWREEFVRQYSENKKLKAIDSGISFIVKST